MRNNRTYRIATMASIAVMLITMSLFVYKTTALTFLLYNFIYATAIIFMDQIDNVVIYRMSQSRCVTNNTRIEYFVFRDFSLFIGRWIGCVTLMYIGVFGGYAWLRWYLIVVSIALAAWGIFNVHLLPRSHKK